MASGCVVSPIRQCNGCGGGSNGGGGSNDAGGRGGGFGSISSSFNKAALDKAHVSFRADGKEFGYTSGISQDPAFTSQFGNNARFSTWSVKDAETGEKLGKTTTVTSPSGDILKQSHGWTGTKRGFLE